jgi:hypothetical protein
VEASGEMTVPLTREFKDTVQARIKRDRKYRNEVLREDLQVRNLLEVIGHVQRAEGLHFELSVKAAS